MNVLRYYDLSACEFASQARVSSFARPNVGSRLSLVETRSLQVRYSEPSFA